MLFRSRGDCYNYFACSKALLDRAGIPNVDLYRVGGGTDHYWQLVNVGGGWYHFDACPHPDSYPLNSFLLDETAVREYTEKCSPVRSNYYVYDYENCPVTAVGFPVEELPPESELPVETELPPEGGEVLLPPGVFATEPPEVEATPEITEAIPEETQAITETTPEPVPELSPAPVEEPTLEPSIAPPEEGLPSPVPEPSLPAVEAPAELTETPGKEEIP